MQLLLTSSGITNTTIREALVGMLGKPIEDCSALCIPTALYGHPHVGPGVMPWTFVTGTSEHHEPMVSLGWRSVGLLELTALPSLDDDRWIPLVREADVVLAAGGDALHLAHWMRESGLADLLPSLARTVWVGMSAGSMVMTPQIGIQFMGWQPPAGNDRALGVVDFAIFPHLGHPDLPDNTMTSAEQWAATIDCSSYAIDDDTAIRVADSGAVDVVSEGTWRRFGR